MRNKLNERLVPIANEGKQYFLYYTGNIYGDEDANGKLIEKEEVIYLDENFNKFMMNVKKDKAGAVAVSGRKIGYDAFVGPHSPEIETIREVQGPNGKKVFKEVYVPNTDKTTAGIWEKASKDELLKYHRILEKQNNERHHSRLY